MPSFRASVLASAIVLSFGTATAADTARKSPPAPPAPAAEPPRPSRFTPDAVTSDGSVTIAGKPVEYTAVAGTIVVHPKGYDDVPQDHPADLGTGDKPPETEAAMSFVAYLRKAAKPEARPVTFLFNGGPGSSTVWLHMGAFGPRRVVTADDTHTPAAPYALVNNDQSLLDASDLVFVDAPGTGFGRVAGAEDSKGKAFFGVDQDAHAFAEFIQTFLSQYGRWNSPKYLFGESYGTTRSAVLAALLADDYSVDLNGVILLSQILNFDASADGAEGNPGVDLPYIVTLPTYAAVAWYHHKLPAAANPPVNADGLPSLLHQVERWATTDYALALAAGAALDPARRTAIANQLHLYTGLPVDYILKANLRVQGGEFEKTLQADASITTGRLDARFSGPDLDPLSKEVDYDPQSSAISSAYVSTFNDYARRVLHYGEGRAFKPFDRIPEWDSKHQQPGQERPADAGSLNVMPDLAAAMKTNPLLKVQLNAGYYDLATPYYEGVYELEHLPIPQSLRSNIEIRQYASGHMVYAHQASLQQLHDNVAGFITRTANQGTAAK